MTFWFTETLELLVSLLRQQFYKTGKLSTIFFRVCHPILVTEVHQVHSGGVMCAWCICSTCVSMWNLSNLPVGQRYDEQLSTRANLAYLCGQQHCLLFPFTAYCCTFNLEQTPDPSLTLSFPDCVFLLCLYLSLPDGVCDVYLSPLPRSLSLFLSSLCVGWEGSRGTGVE